MKHIPFLSFPTQEQEAVCRALADAGIPQGPVCVSRVEFVDPLGGAAPLAAWTSVSTPAWIRTYPSTPEADWLVAFRRELRLGARAAEQRACAGT